MNIDFDSNVKLQDIFKSLQGMDLPVEELDLSVRIFNFLKRNGIHNLQQILSMSADDFVNTDVSYPQSRKRDAYNYIVDELQKLENTGEV